MSVLGPEFVGATLVWVIIGYGLALLFQLYMLYLNWKQSKVKDTTVKMTEVLYEIRAILDDIREILKEKNAKRKKKSRQK